MTPADKPLRSEQIRDELKKRQRAKEVVNVEEERVKVVIVVCGENRYAFYGSDIQEILPGATLSWMPGLPDHLPGLINVRGDIESVIDMRHFLDEKSAVNASPMIAMAVRGEFRSGILIDAIDDVIDIPVNSIRPPLATLNGTARDLVIGGFDHAGNTVAVLDIARIAALVNL